MFAKAVEKKKSAEPKKPATLEQQLFPSSSPAANQTGNKQSFQQFRYSQNVLQPSPSSVHNALSSSALKRTSTEAKMDCHCPNRAHTSGSCDQEVKRATSSPGPSAATKLHQNVGFDGCHCPNRTHTSKRAMSTLGQSAVTKLHQNLDFDENYNDDMVALQESRSISDETIHYPDLPKSQGFTSSATIPWSSSPPEHLQSVSYPNLPSHRPEPTTSEVTSPATEMGIKRRKLPWMEKKEDDAASNEIETPRTQHHTMLEQALKRRDPRDTVIYNAYHDKSKMPRSSKTKAEPVATPGPTKSPYIWDKTASALKKEQKQNRMAAKKQQLVKTLENGGYTGKAKIEEEQRRKTPAKVFLSEEQHKVLKLVSEQQKSVFFTGSAGTGKSVLLRQIIQHLRDHYRSEADRVAVTASTGLAACNVGGVTLHSFAGIGLGKEPVPELVKKVKKNMKAKTRWLRTRVLIIDEISMVDGELFDKLEAIARAVRNNGRPFGGIQLVITGDFFQLPPVPDYSSRIAKFAFDALTWNTSIDHTIGLTQVFRQKDPGKAS